MEIGAIYMILGSLDLIDAIMKCGDEERYPEMVQIAFELSDNGNLGAKGRLARMYRDGKGLKQDPNKAIELYSSILDSSVIWVLELFDVLWKFNKDGMNIVLPNLCIAAQDGNDSAMVRLSKVYFEGLGVEKNIEYSIKWMEKAYKSNPRHGIDYIDLILKCGDEEHYPEIVQIAFELSDNGNLGAKGRLARMYRDGKGVPKSSLNAIMLYREIISVKEFKWARIELFDCLWKADIVDRYPEMLSLIRPLCEHGDKEGIQRLEKMYATGKVKI